jgi:lipoprotein signal peptidase
MKKNKIRTTALIVIISAGLTNLITEVISNVGCKDYLQVGSLKFNGADIFIFLGMSMFFLSCL